MTKFETLKAMSKQYDKLLCAMADLCAFYEDAEIDQSDFLDSFFCDLYPFKNSLDDAIYDLQASIDELNRHIKVIEKLLGSVTDEQIEDVFSMLESKSPLLTALIQKNDELSKANQRIAELEKASAESVSAAETVPDEAVSAKAVVEESASVPEIAVEITSDGEKEITVYSVVSFYDAIHKIFPTYREAIEYLESEAKHSSLDLYGEKMRYSKNESGEYDWFDDDYDFSFYIYKNTLKLS